MTRQDAKLFQSALSPKVAKNQFRPEYADLKKWEAAYLGESINLDDFKSKKAEVDVRRASFEQELARLASEQRLIEQDELETAFIADYCGRVRDDLRHGTVEVKRLALEALAVKVVWHPEKPSQIQEITGSIPMQVVTSARL